MSMPEKEIDDTELDDLVDSDSDEDSEETEEDVDNEGEDEEVGSVE